MKRFLLAAILATSLVAAAPGISAPGPGGPGGPQGHGQMMGGGPGGPMMQERHKLMQETLVMMKDLFGIVRNLSHAPTAEQKKKLDDMTTRLAEIMKEHEDALKKRQEMMSGQKQGPGAQRHQMMQDTMAMLKDTMIIVRNMSHTATPDQKKSLDGMTNRMNDIIKEHAEALQKQQEAQP